MFRGISSFSRNDCDFGFSRGRHDFSSMINSGRRRNGCDTPRQQPDNGAANQPVAQPAINAANQSQNSVVADMAAADMPSIPMAPAGNDTIDAPHIEPPVTVAIPVEAPTVAPAGNDMIDAPHIEPPVTVVIPVEAPVSETVISATGAPTKADDVGSMWGDAHGSGRGRRNASYESRTGGCDLFQPIASVFSLWGAGCW